MRTLLTCTVVFVIAIACFIGCEDDSVLPPPPDQNPPIAPSNLEGEALSSTEIRLTWNDRAENEQGYEIHESVGDQSNFESLEETDVDVISFTLTEKQPATTYYYKVRGFNQGGMGEFSNVTTVTTLSGPPENPSNLIAEAVSSSQVNLIWQDNSDNEEGFKIERRMASAQIWVEVGQTQEDVSSFQDSELTPATAYVYRIIAHNETGDSDYSNEATATTDDPPVDVPVAPTNLVAEAVSSSQINLSWSDNSNNEENFDVERRPEAGGSWDVVQQVGADVTTVYDMDLDANTTYYYRVLASNVAGNSDYSNVAEATTPEQPSEIPEAPSNLQAEAISVNQINISWEDNSDNENGFKIERKVGGTGTWEEIHQTAPDDTSYQNSGLTPSTTYYYRVLAFNTLGNSDYSNETSATTPEPPEEAPDAPTTLSAGAVSSSLINLSWQDNSDNEEGFKIERKTGDAGAWSEIQQVGSNVVNFNDSALDPATTYYYRVRAYNGVGDSDYSNDASATTEQPPDAPSQPFPAHQATDITIGVNLSWSCSDPDSDTLTFSVYFGTSPNPPLVLQGYNLTTFDPGSLEYEETYYWKIVAYDNHENSKEGPVWSFITISESNASETIEINYSISNFTQIESMMSNQNVADSLIRLFDEYSYVHYLEIQGGGGDASITELYTTLPYTPSVGIAKGESDDNEARRTGIGISKEDMFGFNEQGWLNVTDFINSVRTYFILDSKWLEDNDTYIYYWFATNNPIDELIYNLTNGSLDHITIDAYQINGSGSDPEPGEEREFDLTDEVSIMMVWIPPGEFMMGAQDDEQDANEDEYPRHRVTFDYGFWMGKYEITQEQWEAVTGNNPSHSSGVGDDYPVYNISWNDIQDFEDELDNVFRLPSEAEWEYACRAGTQTRFYWGDDANYSQISDYAWYDSNSGGQTHVVGTLESNEWNLYDMSGNVCEWIEDWWHYNGYNNAPSDGSAWLDPAGSARVVRGGRRESTPSDCRSARRIWTLPSIQHRAYGLRLVRDAD